AQLELVDRALPGVEVDLRWRRYGPDGTLGHDPDTGRVARVERSLAIQIADVVGRVPRARETLQPEHRRPDDVHVLLRNRRQLAPEAVEIVAVEPPSAPLEARRIDEVR